jgi:hypothetical protein
MTILDFVLCAPNNVCKVLLRSHQLNTQLARHV